MRSSIVWLLVAAASAGACVVGTLAQAQDAPRFVVAEDTVKDVEVMRRVLLREAMSSRGGGAAGDWRSYDVLVNAHYASPSEAYVVAGQGATIVLRTSDAVAPGADADAAVGADKSSAWDEEAAALEGKAPAAAPRRRLPRYDAQKVDALKVRVLDALAKYGQKIRGLAAADRIAVVVVGGGGGAGLFLEPQVVTTNDDAKGALRAVLVNSGRPSGDRTVLTMTVSVADCQAAAAGTVNAEEFKRRAVVAAY